MSIRTSKRLLAAALLLLAQGCSTSPPNAAGIACEMLVRNGSEIDSFLRPLPGEGIVCAGAHDEGGSYVVFLNSTRRRAIAFQVIPSVSRLAAVQNVGFGTLEPSAGWLLFHTNEHGGFYESNGGSATLEEFTKIMDRCSKKKPILHFRWPGQE